MVLANLELFQQESNKIEGIFKTRAGETAALRSFLSEELSIKSLEAYVKVCQPNAVLRLAPGLNVQVGNYIAPAGGPAIGYALEELLSRCISPGLSPWEAHCLYENLHPFTDCNGRSGRALWLWLMNEDAPLGFLHTFYYQTLKERRA